MPGTTATLLCQHGQDLTACAMCRQHQQAHADLITNLDSLLATARPRLLRLARLNGVSPDAADDIVQETLFEAWHHLSNLREPQRFDAWLDGICRNVCKRQFRARGAEALQRVRLPDPTSDDYSEDFESDIPDPPYPYHLS
jgi:DNA-directed RNA polymerase specialized sigma24 family protein